MTLPQSPPTTSGIVIISGSNSFDPQSSDFPITRGSISVGRTGIEVVGAGGEELATVSGLAGTVTVGRTGIEVIGAGGEEFATISGLAGFVTVGRTGIEVAGHVLGIPEDIGITSTEITTSGVVIMDMFVGAGEVFIVPIVINERLFPIFQGVFPEQDRRIFPVLPQFSTLTPGD